MIAIMTTYFKCQKHTYLTVPVMGLVPHAPQPKLAAKTASKVPLIPYKTAFKTFF